MGFYLDISIKITTTQVFKFISILFYSINQHKLLFIWKLSSFYDLYLFYDSIGSDLTWGYLTLFFYTIWLRMVSKKFICLIIWLYLSNKHIRVYCLLFYSFVVCSHIYKYHHWSISLCMDIDIIQANKCPCL